MCSETKKDKLEEKNPAVLYCVPGIYLNQIRTVIWCVLIYLKYILGGRLIIAII